MVPETSFSRIVPTNSKVLLYGLRLCGKGRSYLKGTEIQKGKWGGGGRGVSSHFSEIIISYNLETTLCIVMCLKAFYTDFLLNYL